MLRKKRSTKNLFTIICVTFLLWNCQNENYQEQIIEDSSGVKTVSHSEVLDYFNQKSLSRKTTSENFLKNIHTDDIKYEKLTNTSELITVIKAETSFTDKYSRVLLLKINNEIKSVVFSMYPNENKEHSDLFSGEIVIKDLDGNFIKGNRVENGIMKSVLLSQQSNNTYARTASRNIENCRENCGHSATNLSCICNEQYLDEVEIQSTPKTNYVSISTIYGDDGGDELYPDYAWPFAGGGSTSADGNNETNDGCPKDMKRSTTGECVCKDGFVMNTNGFCVKKPCPGDPIENVEIVKPGASGLKGGTFGCTRFNSTKTCGGVKGKKKHDGMDIKADVNTPTFSMYDGEVSQIRNSFSPGQYLYGSYGNFVITKSTINGQTVFMKYNHLNQVLVSVGDKVKAGQIIGMNGNTGNAAAKGVTPHIHLQVFNTAWKSINPIDFLKTKFDSNFESIKSTDCN